MLAKTAWVTPADASCSALSPWLLWLALSPALATRDYELRIKPCDASD